MQFVWILFNYRDMTFKKIFFLFILSNLATTYYLCYQIWQPHTDKWAEDLQFSSFLLTFEILVQLFCFFMALVPLRWNRDSGNAARVVLVKLFQDGTIEGTTQPKTIYDAYIKYFNNTHWVCSVMCSTNWKAQLVCYVSICLLIIVVFEFRITCILFYSVRKRQAEATVSNEASSSSRGVAKITTKKKVLWHL